MDDGWWASDALVRGAAAAAALIRIAVAKRDDDDDDDELRIRCRLAINRQNPPPIYRQISLELTTLRGTRAHEWTSGRVEYVARSVPLISAPARSPADICQTWKPRATRGNHALRVLASYGAKFANACVGYNAYSSLWSIPYSTARDHAWVDIVYVILSTVQKANKELLLY